MLLKTNATNRRSQNRKGISLVEVLIALAIFLMSLSVIGQLVDIGSDNALRAKSQNTATRLAMSKMAEIEAGVIVASTSASGDFSQDGDEGWTWEMNSTASDVANLYSVTVTVSRTLRGEPFRVVITQTVFDPQAMGTGAQAQPPPPTSSTEGM
jgi:general secretion pathway protein I